MNMKDTPGYWSWQGMLKRCEYPPDQFYQRYGGRGIKVCARWHRFKFFLKDMGVRPEGRTLHRVNNDGPYTPSNCRWATHKEQAQNRAPKAYCSKGHKLDETTTWRRGDGFRRCKICGYAKHKRWRDKRRKRLWEWEKKP